MGSQKAKEEISCNGSYRLSKATGFICCCFKVSVSNVQAKQRALFSTWVDEEVTIITFHDNLIAVILRIYF